MNVNRFDLCLVTHIQHHSLKEYLRFIEQAVKGGVTIVQLRDKTLPLNELRPIAIAIKSLLNELNIPFLINDYVDLAIEIDAEGVHIGQSDSSPNETRNRLGPEKIIGYSVESFSDLEQANHLNSINYIAASAVFPSQTKTNCKTFWGLKGLQQLSNHSRWPVMAIGGINSSNTSDVIKHGACGIAVVGAIHDHADPYLAAKELKSIIQQEKANV